MLRRFADRPQMVVSRSDARQSQPIARCRLPGTVLLELARRGVSREQAYRGVQRNAMRSFAEQREFGRSCWPTG
jgi:hypothetical protein